MSQLHAPRYTLKQMLLHLEMAEMRRKHPDWIWNRSDVHVLLGVPGSEEGLKTIVEPGNSFSPGHRSYGVSTWLQVDGKLHAPEEMDADRLPWSFHEGSIPVLHSTWEAGEIRVHSSLFADGDAETSDIKNHFSVDLENMGRAAKTFSFFLVIRSFGAAGGPIEKLRLENEHVHVNGGGPVMLPLERPARFGALSYAESGKDISSLLRHGEFPSATSVEDSSSWASGALEYRVTLNPGEKKTLGFICHVHADNWLNFAGSRTLKQEAQRPRREQTFIDGWKQRQSIELALPDRRFVDAFQTQLTHLAMFTVGDEPRISPISYPLWWLRDGSYVLNALNKGGYHAFVERAVRNAAHKDAFGGFGAEGDGPANGIWILTEHYLLTRSEAFLRDVYHHIQRKAELIRAMRQTTAPMKLHNEYRTPEMQLRAENNVMCLAAQHGLIRGRMDHHLPTFWVNGFSYLALRRAAMAARALGLQDTWYDAEAEDLRKALRAHAESEFGKNDRDPNSAFWPTGWADPKDPLIAAGMEKFWNTVRCPSGQYTPEPLWTYFEAGQAHNFLLMGRRDRAWVSIEMFLTQHIAKGLYTYSEGHEDENSCLQWQRARGWDKIRFVTPHGWTAAELFLLLRDCLVREADETLVIGSGVPESWMTQPFAVKNLPTYFGRVSFEYEPSSKTLKVSSERQPKGGIRSELPGNVNVTE
ncbi:MAG TPA: hypothetical protein VFT72_00410 [Opitutaceae bacterium]|nr:hypothetical protein [Opitutaceae bacterium]